MARYDDYDDEESFDFGSLPETQQQEFLYELIGFREDALDRDVHSMFWFSVTCGTGKTSEHGMRMHEAHYSVARNGDER